MIDGLSLRRFGRKHRRTKQWRTRRHPTAWARFGLETIRRAGERQRIADEFMDRMNAALERTS